MGSVLGSATKTEVGSAVWREVGSAGKVESGPISGGGAVSDEDDYITVETTKLTTPMPNGEERKRLK